MTLGFTEEQQKRIMDCYNDAKGKALYDLGECVRHSVRRMVPAVQQGPAAAHMPHKQVARCTMSQEPCIWRPRGRHVTAANVDKVGAACGDPAPCRCLLVMLMQSAT
jgi:hypothetical protein